MENEPWANYKDWKVLHDFYNGKETNMENKKEELKEQLQDIAIPAKETTIEASEIERQAALWLEDHKDFDLITMTKRPEDMPYELYTVIRRVAKKALKRYTSRPGRITEYR